MNLIRSRRLVAAFALVAGLAPTSAFAYKHLEPPRFWGPDNRDPLRYCISDYVEDSLPGTPEEQYAYQVYAIDEGFAVWPRAAACADISSENIGTCTANTGFTYDRENRMTWDDPTDEHEAGILGVTLCLPANGKFLTQIDGKNYTEVLDCDIVFNNDVDWATEEQITGGTCAGETSLLAVATHEIGHLWGLGHSCDQGEACVDQTLREATMFWTGGPCDISSSSPNEDDRQGIETLYGRSAIAVCNRELDPDDPDTIAFGVVDVDGFELECALESNHMAEITKVTWLWGDGESSEGLIGKHTYTTSGNYTLQVKTEGNSEECGDWSFTDRKTGYVRS